MRKSREHDFCLAQGSIFRRDIGHFARPNARAAAALIVGRGKRQLERGMPCDQTAQLTPRVSTRTEDSDRNFMHKECITLHSAPVNDSASPLAQRVLRC